MEILIFFLVFCSGVLVERLWGFFFRSRKYSGTMYVNRDDVSEKIVYSLELNDYPEKLEFKKVVIFKVDSRD